MQGAILRYFCSQDISPLCSLSKLSLQMLFSGYWSLFHPWVSWTPITLILCFFPAVTLLAPYHPSSWEVIETIGIKLPSFSTYLPSQPFLQEIQRKTRACSDRRRGNRFKLKEGSFKFGIRKTFFMMRVMRHWNRLPGEAVDVLSLEGFSARLDGSLSNLT